MGSFRKIEIEIGTIPGWIHLTHITPQGKKLSFKNGIKSEYPQNRGILQQHQQDCEHSAEKKRTNYFLFYVYWNEILKSWCRIFICFRDLAHCPRTESILIPFERHWIFPPLNWVSCSLELSENKKYDYDNRFDLIPGTRY